MRLQDRFRDHLDTEAACADFLLLRLKWVYGDHGPFIPLIGSVDLSARLLSRAQCAQLERFRQARIEFVQWPDQRPWQAAHFCLIHHAEVFACDIMLDPGTGQIEMVGDRPVLQGLIVRRQGMVDGLVRLGDPVTPLARLEDMTAAWW